MSINPCPLHVAFRSFVAGALRTGFAGALIALATHVQAAGLAVVAPNAVKEALVDIASKFEKETGRPVKFTWGGSEAITRRIAEGEVFDVVVSTAPSVGRMVDDGKVDGASRIDFSRSAVGVAARPGLPRPDLSTVDGLRAALLGAQSVAISSGASGRHLEQVFQQLGIAQQLKGRIVQPPSGAQIGEMLARGEADLGFQQVTELMHAKGFVYLGPLPAEVQNYTVWSSAVHVGATQAEAARAFIRALAAGDAAPALRKTGLEPM